MAESRYTRIRSAFWTDEKVLQWDNDAKLLALYLFSNHHRNLLGCYVLPHAYIAGDLEWDMKHVSRLMDQLEDDGIFLYDQDSRIILIANFLEHNPLENPNQVKSAVARIEELPRSFLLIQLKWCIEQLGKPLLQPLLEVLPERYGKQGRRKTDKDTDNPPTPQGVKDNGFDQDKAFEQFWSAYPKKRSKGDAEKAWNKIKPNEQLHNAIMQRLERAKTSVDWNKESGKYIPYPASWLNRKGWEDEYGPTQLELVASGGGKEIIR